MLSRNRRYVKSMFWTCPVCKGFSPRNGVCTPCANGAPPLLGRALGHGVPSCMFNVNAAFLFSNLTAKHAKPKKTKVTIEAGTQPAHASWSAVPLCLEL